MKRTIIPGEIPTKDLHQYLLGSVSPRPIAFVSTIDADGNDNIAPYSFFNAFSSNPPIVVFSSNRRVSNNTTKDTLHNIQLNKECVINAVSYDIVRQMALSSVELAPGESEYDLTGLTPVESTHVKPKALKESPVNMECRVNDIITLGEHGGAGHLIICEVLAMHIREDVIEDDRINPHKIDLMGRMGRSFYVRASGDAIHTIYQAVVSKPIGYQNLPEQVRTSTSLTANDIASLAALTELPSKEQVDAAIKEYGSLDSDKKAEMAKALIHKGSADEALALLMSV